MKEQKQKKTLSEIHKNHRSRMKETYLKHGFSSMSDIEKLEFILFFAISRKDTNPIAHRLIDAFGSLSGVLEAPISALAEIEGMGEHSAIFINSLLNICSEYGKNKCIGECISTKNAGDIARKLFMGAKVEEFYILCLNKTNKILNVYKFGNGTASEVKVDIRDITKVCIENNCERIILLHNHPNGEAFPSDEDLSFTSRILYSCIINNIEVLDHIILADDNVFSFEESKTMASLKSGVLDMLNIKDKEKIQNAKKKSAILNAYGQIISD